MKKRYFKNLINESKEDEERFITKFGQERFNLFKKQHNNIIKQYDNNHGDMTWAVSHLSEQDLDTLLNATKSLKDQEQSELDKIVHSEEAKQAKKIYDKDGFEIYKIMSVAASIKYGLVVGGRAKWCTSGGYGDVKDGSIYNSASKFYNQYLAEKYSGYYICFAPDGSKYNICPLKSIPISGKVSEIWEGKNDTKVNAIPGLIEDIIDPDDGSVIYSITIKTSEEDLKKIIKSFAIELDINTNQVNSYTLDEDGDIEAIINEDEVYKIVTYDRAKELALAEYDSDYLYDFISSYFSNCSYKELPWMITDNLNPHGLDDKMKEDIQDFFRNDSEVVAELINSHLGETIKGIEIIDTLSEDDLTYEQLDKLRVFVVDEKIAQEKSGLDYFLEFYDLDELPGDYSDYIDLNGLKNTLNDQNGLEVLCRYDATIYEFCVENDWYVSFREE